MRCMGSCAVKRVCCFIGCRYEAEMNRFENVFDGVAMPQQLGLIFYLTFFCRKLLFFFRKKFGKVKCEINNLLQHLQCQLQILAR